MMLNWFMKYFGDAVDVEKDRSKRHLTKMAVHLYDGRTIVHYCSHYQIYQDGKLALLNKEGDKEDFVALYPSNTFMSVSRGKRQIANYGTNIKLKFTTSEYSRMLDLAQRGRISLEEFKQFENEYLKAASKGHVFFDNSEKNGLTTVKLSDSSYSVGKVIEKVGGLCDKSSDV